LAESIQYAPNRSNIKGDRIFKYKWLRHQQNKRLGEPRESRSSVRSSTPDVIDTICHAAPTHKEQPPFKDAQQAKRNH
jgi:hypothetical protein